MSTRWEGIYLGYLGIFFGWVCFFFRPFCYTFHCFLLLGAFYGFVFALFFLLQLFLFASLLFAAFFSALIFCFLLFCVLASLLFVFFASSAFLLLLLLLLLFCFFAALLLCFSASLLLCFSVFSAFLFFFLLFAASLLCLSAFVSLFFFFSESFCFALVFVLFLYFFVCDVPWQKHGLVSHKQFVMTPFIGVCISMIRIAIMRWMIIHHVLTLAHMVLVLQPLYMFNVVGVFVSFLFFACAWMLLSFLLGCYHAMCSFLFLCVVSGWDCLSFLLLLFSSLRFSSLLFSTTT